MLRFSEAMPEGLYDTLRVGKFFAEDLPRRYDHAPLTLNRRHQPTSGESRAGPQTNLPATGYSLGVSILEPYET